MAVCFIDAVDLIHWLYDFLILVRSQDSSFTHIFNLAEGSRVGARRCFFIIDAHGLNCQAYASPASAALLLPWRFWMERDHVARVETGNHFSIQADGMKDSQLPSNQKNYSRSHTCSTVTTCSQVDGLPSRDHFWHNKTAKSADNTRWSIQGHRREM